MKQTTSAALAAPLTLLMAASASAQDAKWGPHIDLEAKPGSKRSLGEGDAFIPLAQDADTLLFANLRHRFDDNDSAEGNYGLGVRHMLESGWNLGGYGYFDRRRTEYGNHFHQVTLGVEALSMDWDARANYYAPVGRTTHLVDRLSTAEISGTSVIFRGGEERSMGGFDAELGWRIPIFDVNDGKALRIYGGGYRFADDGVETVAGPRLRAEMTFDSLPNSWEGSRFSIGAEWQHDDPRGSQGFLTARLRIPLQVYGKPASTLTPMERRMADPVVRDVDVVSQAGTFGPPETATQLANGAAITVINSSTPGGADLRAAVDAAASNAAIILSGSFNITNSVDLASGKSLMAGNVAVRSASGRTAVLNTPATINGPDLLIMAYGNNTISGLRLVGYGPEVTGIQTNGGSNITIRDNTISLTHDGGAGGSAFTGVFISTGSNISVIGNTISVRGLNGWVSGVRGGSATNVTVAGNSFDITGGNNNYMAYLSNSSIASGSTGNVQINGNCSVTTTSGSIGFTNGTPCP